MTNNKNFKISKICIYKLLYIYIHIIYLKYVQHTSQYSHIFFLKRPYEINKYEKLVD